MGGAGQAADLGEVGVLLLDEAGHLLGETVAEVAAETVADVPVLGLGVARLREGLVLAQVGVEVLVVDVSDVDSARVERSGRREGGVLRVDQAGDRGRPLPARLGGAQVGVGRLQRLRLPLVRPPPVRGVPDDLAQGSDVGGALPLPGRLLVQVAQDVARDRPDAVLGRVLRLGHVVQPRVVVVRLRRGRLLLQASERRELEADPAVDRFDLPQVRRQMRGDAVKYLLERDREVVGHVASLTRCGGARTRCGGTGGRFLARQPGVVQGRA
ncbi:hypothetical protein B5181_05740 [Streptomyces sp. 4F]|nr:hypothetical protein B5181_05740 [Streptomyces sp. 4F]